MDLARRVVPEPVRVALSKNLSREARERLLADQWRGATDWSRTTAFALPSSYTSMIRVNLAGREPAGTVDPGAAYEALLAQLTEDLFALREPQSGRPLARRVVRSDQAFGPESLRLLPDLFVEWEAFPTFVTRAVHPRAEITQRVPEFYRGTDHWPSGFFAAAGPDVAARGDLGTVSVLDLAPTFLDLWGEPVPARMEGRGVPVRRPP
jgi:predicted AlkP superfamily phosphohydrolase/phosphomutase